MSSILITAMTCGDVDILQRFAKAFWWILTSILRLTMNQADIPEFRNQGFEVYEWRHASAILRVDFPSEWKDICDVLLSTRVPESYVTVKGGGRSLIAQEHDAKFTARGWKKKRFKTEIKVDDATYASPTHEVDCYKNKIALELEWSNKDPFFDRDLNNFRLLFDLRTAHVGIIVTKADDLREVFEQLGIWSKYGTTTTWISKLLPRVEGGGGGGCPLLVFGITKERFDYGK